MEPTVIVGAGVIGLALAEELAQRGLRVLVLDRGTPERQGTSWAAAGIIPPANWHPQGDAYGQLCHLSVSGFEAWCDRLLQQTGVDPEYWACGGLQLARSAGEMAALASSIEQWRREGIEVERLATEQLLECEPGLRPLIEREQLRAAYWVPGESQVRSSRLLKSLRQACRARGVEIQHGIEVQQLVCKGNRVVALATSKGDVAVDRVCLATGAWTDHLLRTIGIQLDVSPRRGQMALLAAPVGLLRHVINEGPRYLVPRRDGQVLVGATVEDVGYDWSTDDAVERLREFAIELVPSLAGAPLLRSWAGLRPYTNDGVPYLGRVPGMENSFVATGHFRSGIVLAPATARVMSDLILGTPPAVDVSPFRLDR